MKSREDMQPVEGVLQDQDKDEAIRKARAMLRLVLQGEEDILGGRHSDSRHTHPPPGLPLEGGGTRRPEDHR